MSESEAETEAFGVLTVDPSRAGETVTVESTGSGLSLNSTVPGVVDEDGVVKQKDGDFAFNSANYEVKE